MRKLGLIPFQCGLSPILYLFLLDHMMRYIPVPLKFPLIFSENSFMIFSTVDLSGRHQRPHGARGTPQHQGADAATKRSESLLYQTKWNEDASNKVHQSTWAGTSTCLWRFPPVSILVKAVLKTCLLVCCLMCLLCQIRNVLFV